MRRLRRNQGLRLAMAGLMVELAAPVSLAAQVHTPRFLWDDLDRQHVAERADHWVDAAASPGTLDQVWS